jgi:hypothetical protein
MEDLTPSHSCSPWIRTDLARLEPNHQRLFQANIKNQESPLTPYIWLPDRPSSCSGSSVEFAVWFAWLVFTLTYVAAKVFQIVECFMNVAHLPDAVFHEPSCSK